MNEQKIFKHLFTVAKTSKDPQGVVAAALVKNNKVLISLPSSDDGNQHAEYRVLQEALKRGIRLTNRHTLYATVEPCGRRNPHGKGVIFDDCTTNIINASIRRVIYAVPDPDASSDVKQRMTSAGIEIRQIRDLTIIKRALKIFNDTCQNSSDRIIISEDELLEKTG